MSALLIIFCRSRLENPLQLGKQQWTSNSDLTPSTSDEQPLISNDSELPVTVGTFVAVYLDKYEDEQSPMIGQITTIKENGDLQLDWFVGSYSGVWNVCRIRRQVWNEEVLSNSLSDVL